MHGDSDAGMAQNEGEDATGEGERKMSLLIGLS